MAKKTKTVKGEDVCELRMWMSPRSVERLRVMQGLANASAREVIKDALRVYEQALKKGHAAEAAGGVVYLTVKYPDGRTEEEAVFKTDTDS